MFGTIFPLLHTEQPSSKFIIMGLYSVNGRKVHRIPEGQRKKEHSTPSSPNLQGTGWTRTAQGHSIDSSRASTGTHVS